MTGNVTGPRPRFHSKACRSQLPSYMSVQSQDNAAASQIGLDSITLGQLKAMVGSAPKPKAGVAYLSPT